MSLLSVCLQMQLHTLEVQFLEFIEHCIVRASNRILMRKEVERTRSSSRNRKQCEDESSRKGIILSESGSSLHENLFQKEIQNLRSLYQYFESILLFLHENQFYDDYFLRSLDLLELQFAINRTIKNLLSQPQPYSHHLDSHMHLHQKNNSTLSKALSSENRTNKSVSLQRNHKVADRFKSFEKFQQESLLQMEHREKSSASQQKILDLKKKILKCLKQFGAYVFFKMKRCEVIALKSALKQAIQKNSSVKERYLKQIIQEQEELNYKLREIEFIKKKSIVKKRSQWIKSMVIFQQKNS